MSTASRTARGVEVLLSRWTQLSKFSPAYYHLNILCIRKNWPSSPAQLSITSDVLSKLNPTHRDYLLHHGFNTCWMSFCGLCSSSLLFSMLWIFFLMSQFPITLLHLYCACMYLHLFTLPIVATSCVFKIFLTHYCFYICACPYILPIRSCDF